MENYDSMVFYSSFYEGIKDIPDDMPEMKLKLYDVILTYGLYGIEIEVEWQLKTAWRQIKAQIDANNKRRESGQKGGLQKAKNRAEKNVSKSVANFSKSVAPCSDTVANVNVNANLNDNANANLNDNDNVNDMPATEKSDAVNYYLDYINPAPSHTLIQTIESYILDGKTDECLIAIFEYCRDNNKTNWAYIKKAVEGSFNDGIRTLDDYNRNRAEREKSYTTSKPQAPAPKKKSAFHNFEQRDIDYDEIEDEYFAWVKGEE